MSIFSAAGSSSRFEPKKRKDEPVVTTSFSHLITAMGYWQRNGCSNLPSVAAINKAQPGSVWTGQNTKTGKAWQLVKHGPGSHSCYY